MKQGEYFLRILDKYEYSIKRLAELTNVNHETLRLHISENTILDMQGSDLVRIFDTLNTTLDGFCDAIYAVECEYVAKNKEEKNILVQYRKTPEYRNAVKKLLGVAGS